MALNYLSGIDEMEIDYLNGRAERKARRDQRKKDRAESGKKGIFKKVAKIGLAPSRAAFLTAVRINALKIASRLANLYKKNPSKFNEFWTKFGGDPNELKKTVAKGSKETLNGEMGFDPGAALAAALPIIQVLLKTLKTEGVATEGISEEDEKSAIDAMKDNLNQDTTVDKDIAQMPEETEAAVVKAKVEVPTEMNETETTGKNKKVLLYAGIGVAALLILPKILKK